MTKRFEWDSALDKVYDYDKPCAGTFTSYHEWEIVDLLNDQHEEKEQLKQENKELKAENEKLKQQLKIYKNDGLETLNDLERAYENNKKALSNIEQLDKENRELKKENEQLKLRYE